jgi:hypothetical protein
MSKENKYKFNEDIVNILSPHRDDEYEMGCRGWVRPNSKLQSASWAIFINKPWKYGKDEEETKELTSATEILRATIESNTTVYSVMSDEMQDWDKEGLTSFMNTIQEVLRLWDDLDEQEAKNNG